MTVGELIELLQQQDSESLVLLSYDYGDHCHTTVAENIASATEMDIVHSDYHKTYRVIEETEDDDYRDEEDKQRAVILSSSMLW